MKNVKRIESGDLVKLVSVVKIRPRRQWRFVLAIEELSHHMETISATCQHI